MVGNFEFLVLSFELINTKYFEPPLLKACRGKLDTN